MFQDTVNLSVFPFGTRQNATTLPTQIWPVYIGSGKLILSLDATGMQGLNNRIQHAYTDYPCADCYTVGQGMVSDVLTPNNTHPYGYLDYDVVVDGTVFNTEAIEKEGSLFSRHNDIRRGIVTTTYLLRPGVWVEIRAFAPYGKEEAAFSLRVKSYNAWNPNDVPAHTVTVRTHFHLLTRDGRPLYTAATQDGNHRVRFSVEGHERYERQVSLFGGAFSYRDSVLTVSETVTAEREWSHPLDFLLSFENEPSSSAIDALLKEHISAWKAYYDACAEVDWPEARQTFLYHNSLYLLRAGFSPAAYGFPIGHPFYYPGCWNQCIFWDMQFLEDALLRAGQSEIAREGLAFLLRHMRKAGKPYPWMFIYDGTTFLDEKRDIAPLVIAAHAMTAIRYYEITRNETDLRTLCFPILRRVTDYALDALFRKNENGKFIISLPVSNDVCDEEGEEINQTFTTLWFLTVLRKTVAYAQTLGEPLPEEAFEICKDGNYYLENDGYEYLHSKGWYAKDWRWASWLPFLAYPTEGMPFLDRDLLRHTREKYCYVDLYRDKQNCYQPWTECIEAQAACRSGEFEEADRLSNIATEQHVFGDGYFSEVGPRRQTGAFPPYISAHGSYTAFFLDRIFCGSVWEQKLSVLEALPLSLRSQNVRARNVHAVGGAVLHELSYSPFSLSAEITLPAGVWELRVRIPNELLTPVLYVNGVSVPYKTDARAQVLCLSLPLHNTATCRFEIE